MTYFATHAIRPWKYTISAITADNAPYHLVSGEGETSLKAAYQVYKYIQAMTPPKDHILQSARVTHSDPYRYGLVETYLDGFVYDIEYNMVQPCNEHYNGWTVPD
jgi:hypothetical protein